MTICQRRYLQDLPHTTQRERERYPNARRNPSIDAA
jgi:hypothetical protein